jgi:hypothetical protein
MPHREDDVAPRTGVTSTRTLTLVGGFVLALAATLVVFLTDNPQFLRVAVVAVAWAFVLATFAAGHRGTDRVAAAAREAELRRAYERELEREVSARREYELELENELRRETEDAMRYELDALRDDIAALSSLRDEVARVAALREDVAALSSLRQDLGQLAELRADMGRLRAELTEQLSSEMLIERIVMRTQASRVPTGSPRLDSPSRTLDGAAGWADDVPPRELTGGWPAVRLDEPQGTQQFEQVRVERSAVHPPVPATAAFGTPAPPPASSTPPPAFSRAPNTDPHVPQFSGGTSSRHGADEPTPLPTTAFPLSPPPGGRSGTPPPTTASPIAPPPVTPAAVAPPPSPLEWLAARSLLDPSPTSFRPDVPPRRRRGDEEPADPATASTAQGPAVASGPPGAGIDDRGGHRVAVPEDEPAAERPGSSTEGNRLAEILAENGVSPATGGRRRRRYRDEDDSDDVLARVLRSN